MNPQESDFPKPRCPYCDATQIGQTEMYNASGVILVFHCGNEECRSIFGVQFVASIPPQQPKRSNLIVVP